MMISVSCGYEGTITTAVCLPDADVALTDEKVGFGTAEISI